MAFNRPTLSELVDQTQQDLASRLSLVAPILRRSVVYVLARVIAGALHLVYGFLDWLSRQMFPDEADEDRLVRFAGLFGLTKKAAGFAQYQVAVTGTNGAVIQAGSVLQRADGAEFSTDADVTIANGTATASVTAALAGAAGTCAAGVGLSFESPIAGVISAATVLAGGTDGVDEETLDEFRGRVLDRLRAPPHGGSAADYVAWAKEVAGVTRAWCYPLELGPGTVVVRFVRDDDAAIIPTADEVAAVQAHIDTGTKNDGTVGRPVTAIATVEAPVADVLNYTLHIAPDTPDTRAAVDAALRDLLFRMGAPGGTIPLSQIEVAIGTADGVTDFTLASPAADVVHATGHIAVPGALAFT